MLNRGHFQHVKDKIKHVVDGIPEKSPVTNGPAVYAGLCVRSALQGVATPLPAPLSWCCHALRKFKRENLRLPPRQIVFSMLIYQKLWKHKSILHKSAYQYFEQCYTFPENLNQWSKVNDDMPFFRRDWLLLDLENTLGPVFATGSPISSPARPRPMGSRPGPDPARSNQYYGGPGPPRPV